MSNIKDYLEKWRRGNILDNDVYEQVASEPVGYYIYYKDIYYCPYLDEEGEIINIDLDPREIERRRFTLVENLNVEIRAIKKAGAFKITKIIPLSSDQCKSIIDDKNILDESTFQWLSDIEAITGGIAFDDFVEFYKMEIRE